VCSVLHQSVRRVSRRILCPIVEALTDNLYEVRYEVQAQTKLTKNMKLGPPPSKAGIPISEVFTQSTNDLIKSDIRVARCDVAIGILRRTCYLE